METTPVVFVVDDDHDTRDFISTLMQTVGLAVQTYDSAEAFLHAYEPNMPGCLVVDLRMPGMSGLELQRELSARDCELPIIVISAYGEVTAAVRAIKDGATDFLPKPFSSQVLLERVQEAIKKDRQQRNERIVRNAFAERLARLTPREREVMELVVAGKPNKVIAMTLGVSEKTVEVHRAQVMRKLQVDSLAELVRLAVSHTPQGR